MNVQDCTKSASKLELIYSGYQTQITFYYSKYYATQGWFTIRPTTPWTWGAPHFEAFKVGRLRDKRSPRIVYNALVDSLPSDGLSCYGQTFNSCLNDVKTIQISFF